MWLHEVDFHLAYSAYLLGVGTGLLAQLIYFLRRGK